MSFPIYPAYKESGIEWLGTIPKHWSCACFKWEIKQNDGGVWGEDPIGNDDTIVLRSTEQTADGKWRIDDPALRKLSATELSSALLSEGDLLITKASGSSLHIGKTTRVTSDIAAMNCCFSNFMQRVRTKESYSNQLAYYFMNSDLARLQFDLLSNSTTGLANLNGKMIGSVMLPLPTPGEQPEIVAFLDRETRKIDALIEEQQRLIDLLNEKRQAVISHAVTKGLNPDAPMKDSGVEWLGEVPMHWSLSRIKHLTTHIVDCLHTTPTYDGELIYPAVRTADLERGCLLIDQIRLVAEEVYQERIQRLEPRAGDILYSREGERFGMAALVPEDTRLCLGQRMMMFRIDALNDPCFVMWALNSEAVYQQVISLVAGSTSPHVNISDIRNFHVALPPLDEQAKIGRYLSLLTAELDGLEIETQSAITLLQERRSALISAAVTGKIDVRGLVASEAEAA